MIYLQNIDILQVEISNFCNADCQGCVRMSPTALSLFKEEGTKFLPIKVFENIFNTNIGKKIKEIEFCGTVDEPFAHKYFFDLIDVIYKYNPTCKISIHTNGSLRNNEFYKILAEKLNRFPQHIVRFSIDGRQKSHYLYRGIQEWDKIIEHADVFIKAGGRALWQMLEFPWNQKDVNKCRRLAKKLGMIRFVLRRDRSEYSNRGKKAAENFRTRKIRHTEDSPIVKLAKLKRDRNLTKKETSDVEQRMIEIKKRVDQIVEKFDHKPEIKCHFKKENKMFLDYTGAIWPCCFVANPMVRGLGQYKEMENKVFLKHGENFNSLFVFNLDEIMKNDYYTKDLVKSWTEEYSFESGCLSTCIKQCSQKSIPIGEHLEKEDFV